MTTQQKMVGPGWHGIETEVRIHKPIKEVFDFFADAGNLERITPPELGFRIVTPQPIDIKEGALIEYRLGLFGVPFSWLTRISSWSPPHQFVDEQLKGPYRVWHHTHTFVAVDENTTDMFDEVRYRLPLFPVGEVALPMVALQVKRIFNYRNKTILEHFHGDEENAFTG